MYIIEAGLEYLIAILVSGTFLAQLTNSLGFSDSLTGILSSIISLGCLFQTLSVFYRKKTVKKYVVGLSIANQLLFMLLFVIPLGEKIPSGVKTALFIGLIVVAYFLYYIAHPKKINWLMSLVDPAERGKFTAVKEIISLLMGITFSFLMGKLVDYYKDRGEIRTAFLFCAAAIFLLMVGHTLTLLFSVEPELPQPERKKGTMLSLLKDKNLWKIALLFSGWYLASYVSTPFYGTYQIDTLGFSQSLAVALASAGSVIRMFVELPWGRYADRNSFAAMLRGCLLFAFLAFVCAAIARPGTGIVCFALYQILQGIASGGISSALINVVFESVPVENRADSLAITQAIAGTCGFLATLAVSPLISYVQNNGNRLFSIPVYAQQVTSVVSAFLILLTVVYLSFVIMKKKKN